MPKLFLSLAMLCMFGIAHAQKGALTLSLGPSIPLGDFASETVQSNSSGLAETGLFISLGYTHHVGKYISLTAMLRGQRNALNTAALENVFSTSPLAIGPIFSNGYEPPPPVPGTVYPNWKFEKDHWLTGSLLLGMQAQLPSKQKLSVSARAMLGPTYVSSPEVKGQSYTDTATATMTQSGPHAWGVGYLIGGGVQYNVSQKIFITGGVELFGTNKITFEDITAAITTTKGNPQTPGYSVAHMTTKGDGKQTITTLNVSVGIGWRL